MSDDRRALDRRRVDRRDGERRARVRRADAPQPWFAARDGADGAVGDSTAPLDWAAAADGTDPPPASGFERIYRVFLGARAALGIVLVVALLLAAAFGTRPNAAVGIISLAYAAWAACMWLLASGRPAMQPAQGGGLCLGRRPWLAAIGVDIVAFFALHLLSNAASISNVALLVLPVLMAGALTPRLHALATVAAVTIGLLAAGWLGVLAGGEPTVWLTQAALAGSGFFIIAGMTSDLAARLAREEAAARGGLAMVRQQVRLNRLVIEELQDGVLVVDRRGWVRTANPTARRLLVRAGMAPPAPFPLSGQAPWQALVATVATAFGDEVWPEEGRDVALAFEAPAARTLRVRIRFTRRPQAGEAAAAPGALAAPAVPPASTEEYCVVLLEDVRSMQARNRQEKLAAMGRVSAGIAHEIRNPLAAISQANALLAEDAATPTHQQLTRMVAANVDRLKRIVDDVMAAAPAGGGGAAVIDLTAATHDACREWCAAAAETTPDARRALLVIDSPDEPLAAWFDPEHLRRVVDNLLDNARRHGSGRPASISVRIRPTDALQVTLSVQTDGPPIPEEVERHLFEPFFSTRSRGTGLGLYICRELCERYSARIDHRVVDVAGAQRNEFFVVMRRRPPR